MSVAIDETEFLWHGFLLNAVCERSSELYQLGAVGCKEGKERRENIEIIPEIQPGHPVGLIRLAGIERELSEILGREADLRTPADLSRYFRQAVLDSAEEHYHA